jgi:hypothetical protein
MTLEVRHAYVICVEWLKHTYLVPVVSVVVENGDIITWYTWSPTYEDVHLKK